MVVVYATGGSQPQLDLCSLPLQQTCEDSVQCWHAYACHCTAQCMHGSFSLANCFLLWFGTLTSESSGPQYMCMLVIAVHATGGVLKRGWGCSYNKYRPVAYTFR